MHSLCVLFRGAMVKKWLLMWYLAQKHITIVLAKEGTLVMAFLLKLAMILKGLMHAIIGWWHSVNFTYIISLMGLFVICEKLMKSAWAYFQRVFLIVKMMMYKLVHLMFVTNSTNQINTNQVKKESNYHISDLQDNKMGLKKEMQISYWIKYC